MKFTKAENVTPYKKVAVFGSAGSGKTVLALSGPGKKMIVDTEGGSLSYSQLTSFEVLHTQSFGEIKEVIDDLQKNPPKDETTLIVDSASIIWAGLQQAMLEKKLGEKGFKAGVGTESVAFSMADWGILKRWHKDILNTLMSLKCHVICTFRENEPMKEETDERGNKVWKRSGTFVPEWERSSPYTFDFVVRIHDRKATFIKGRSADGGRLVDLVGKTVAIPCVEDGSELPSIWDALFGKHKTPNAGHPETSEKDDTEKVEKNPESLKLAKEIRATHLPKSGITNDELEMYLLTKTTKDGSRVVEKAADGKVHLSDMKPEHLRWLVGLLTDGAKLMQLAGKISELKKGDKK